MLRTFSVLALMVAAFVGSARPADAQPYAWIPLQEFRDFSTPLKNVLRIVNLGTTHVQSVDLPDGIAMGQGAIDPITGHYFLITPSGTGEFATSPPRLLPGFKPWSGNALYLSPDGAHAYVCSGLSVETTCALVRRSDDQVLATRARTSGINFDHFGGHLVSSIGPGETTLTISYFAAASPTVVAWTRDYTFPRFYSPRIAVSGDRVFVVAAATIEILDSVTGAVVRSGTPLRAHSLIAAGGGRLFGIGFDGSGVPSVRLTAYAADTLGVSADVVISGPLRPSTPQGVAVTSDGTAVIVRLTNGYAESLSLRSADSLQFISGGGFPGLGTTSAAAFSSHSLCRVAVAPSAIALPAGGGAATYAVVPGDGCGIWPTTAGFEAFALIGSTARTGPGEVTYVAAQNVNAYMLTRSFRIAGVLVNATVLPVSDVPLPPRTVGVDMAAGLATVSWEPSRTGPIPSGFVIEGGRAGGPISARFTASSTARSLALPTLSAGEYFVQIRAVNRVGEGAASPAVRLGVGPSTAPDAPTSVVTDVQASVIRLHWSPTTTGAAASRYIVEGAVSGGTFIPIGSTVAGIYELAIVAPPALYGTALVRVRAVNAAGSSAATPPVTVTLV